MRGTDRRMPKLAPNAINIRLLGPGVIEVTKAKIARTESIRFRLQHDKPNGIAKSCKNKLFSHQVT